jgi:hypothetical protein
LEQAVAGLASLFKTQMWDLASRGMNLLGVIALDFFFQDRANFFKGR